MFNINLRAKTPDCAATLIVSEKQLMPHPINFVSVTGRRIHLFPSDVITRKVINRSVRVNGREIDAFRQVRYL